MNLIENENLINLVRDAQNGVDGAFDKLYAETIKHSYNAASLLLKNEKDIEDALQNSYMYVARYIKDLKNPESFENWLSVIVKHECQKYIASTKRVSDIFTAVVNSEEMDFSVEADLPDDVFDSDEKRSEVRRIVDSLPDDKRACVVLYYFEQHTLPEIAEILGVPVGTVKSRLFKARKVLEKEFRKLQEKDETFYGFSIIPLIIGLFVWQSKNVVVPLSVANGASACVAAASTAATAASTATATTAGATVTAASATTATTAGAATGAAAVTAKVAAVVVAASVVTGGSVATVNYVKNRKEAETTKATTSAVSEEYTTAVESALTEIAVFPSETSVTDIPSLTLPKDEISNLTSVSHTENSVATTAKTVTTKPVVTTTKPITTATRPVTTTRQVTTTRIITTTKPVTTTKPITTTKPVTTTRAATTTSAPTTNAADVFTVSGGVLSEYKGSAGDVSVPSKVGSENITAIGSGAFEGNTRITSVSLPSTVTRIGQSAFYDCTNLKSVSLPSSLQSIGLGAFCNCTSLSSINVPSGVTTIGDDAFADCTSLSTVTIPSSVTSIGDNAFGGCDNLTIKCTEGSAAHDYAVENSINFELI